MIIRYGIKFTVLFIVTEATIFNNVPVSPCSLNKIAPRRQRDNQIKKSSRTFANFLGEETDEDASDFGQDDDCIGINQEIFNNNNRPSQITQPQAYIFGNWFPNIFWRPPVAPVPTMRPMPSRPKPTRPPQGGYFGNNNYNPQNIFSPSNIIKPVHENTQETYQQPSYQPTVVGGPVNQIVGVSAGSMRPQPLPQPRPRPRPSYNSRVDIPNNNRRNGIIVSFVDLLFQ